MRKVDITEALLKGAAVSGIAFAWVNFTLKAFKMAWHIISTSPEDAVSTVVCDECESRFLNDGYDPENDRVLCENCRPGGENSYFQ